MSQPALGDEAWSPGEPADVEIDGYRDLKLIATGRDSTVYRARQLGSDHPVAVKILIAGPQALDVAVRLGSEHPHIVKVLGARTLPDGRACVVMPLCHEGSLHDRLRARGPLPHTEVIAIGVAVADALAHAHGQGVVHGEVRPRKILALPPSYVLAGFEGRTADADPAEDISALGSALSTLLSGRPAPAPLAAIIARCHSDRRDDRFLDAASLRDALSALRTSDRVWAPELAPGVWAIRSPRVASAPEPPSIAVPHDPPPIFAAQPSPALPVPAPVVEAPPGPPRQLPDPRPAPSWPRLAFLAGISLLLGGLLTFGIAWVRTQTTAPTAAGESGRPVQALGALPSIVTGPDRVNDPAIAPQITNLTDRSTSLAISWADRSGGKAVFVVVEVTGAGAVPLIQVPAGQTSVEVERIDPARPYCLAVLAVTDTAQAISPLQCTGVRGTSR